MTIPSSDLGKKVVFADVRFSDTKCTRLECSVVDSIMPGTHELFIGKVEAVHVNEEYLDANGNILGDKMDLIQSADSRFPAKLLLYYI